MKYAFCLLLIAAGAFSAAAQTKSLRKIDWNDFAFRIGGKIVRMNDGLEIGACRTKAPQDAPAGDVWNVNAETAAYGDLDGDGVEEAFVPLVANVCGGNMITDETVLVYQLKNGRPVQLPEFDYYDEGCRAGEKNCNFSRSPGATVSYDARLRALVIETGYATEDDALCCPSHARKTWYQWNGRNFVVLKKSKIEAVRRDEM
jgi:hypothetical protein